MSGIKFGYARVSTRDQTHGQQSATLLAYGCERRRIFTDTCSGAVWPARIAPSCNDFPNSCGRATCWRSGTWIGWDGACRTC